MHDSLAYRATQTPAEAPDARWRGRSASALSAGTPAGPGRVSVSQVGWSPARLAYWFYGVAAAGAVIGQTWVAVTHLPWAPGVPGAARVAAVAPFALCLELLAMALAAMADERMRLGERAYGLRIFSAVVATAAVGILVAGHWPQLCWSAAFGVLSGAAYVLWILHSAARRRDGLRASGKLADTAPDYGLWRRLRHPVWTARAAELAREGCADADGWWRPLGLYESLRAAQQLTIRDEKRRPAIARAVEQVVRADQRDPQLAEVAVRTLDLDRLAAELARRVDYAAWADRLAPGIAASLPMTGAAGEESLADAVRKAAAVPGTGHGTVPRDTAARAVREPQEDSSTPVGKEEDGPADSVPRAKVATTSVDLTAVADLVPAARAARAALAAHGQRLSRDALAARMREDGYAVSNARASVLYRIVERRDVAEPAGAAGQSNDPVVRENAAA